MKIEALAAKPDKLETRAEYLKGQGYDVELTVVYRRTRRVRALNEEQAKDFAMSREANYAPKYFHAQNHGNYCVDSIEAGAVTPAPPRKEGE